MVTVTIALMLFFLITPYAFSPTGILPFYGFIIIARCGETELDLIWHADQAIDTGLDFTPDIYVRRH